MNKKVTLATVGNCCRRIVAPIMVFALVFFGYLSLFQQPQPAQAATSKTVNFQARLMNAAGAIVPDGNYNVEFKLYNALTSSGSSQGSCSGDSACLWAETRTSSNTVRVANGYLSVELGSVTALPTSIDWSQNLYLTMNIGGKNVSPTWDGEMSPRLHLTAVPHAFTADQLSNTSGSFTSTLGFTTPTANRSILLPDEAGTLCIQNSANCGFALSTGSGSYIQNGTSLQSGANFNISGTGTAATALQAPLFDTSSAAALNIGTTNATSINLKKSTTITGGLTQSGGAISLTGNAASSITTTTGALSIQPAGNLNLTTTGTNTINLTTGSAGVIVKPTTDNGAAFQVQNAAGSYVFNVNTVFGLTNIGLLNVGIGTNTATIDSTNSGDTITIGATNAGAVTIGRAAGTTTIQGGTGSSAIALNTASNGKISISAQGSGGINASVGGNGFTLKTTTNSSTAFSIQDSSNSYLFTANTSTGTITLGAIQTTYSGLDGTLNAPFGTLTLGRSAATTTILGSAASTFQATSGSFTTTLSFATPTANRAIVLPDEGGTVCIRNSTNCGFAATSGSANYIQNTTTAQSANMYVQAATSGSVAGILRANAAGTGNILNLQNGAGTNIATFGSAGAVTLQNSTNSTAGFQVLAASGGGGNAVLRVDTTNERVAVGVISDPIGAKLSVATGSTVTLRGYQGSTFDAFQLGNATADFLTVGSTGNLLLKPTTNSTTAFQIQNAAGTSNLLFADTSNTRIAIAQATAAYTLDVAGDINSTTQIRVGSNIVCDSTGCNAKSGSGFYIHNQTTAQSSNLYVQAATSGSVAGVFQANASGSGDILDLKNGAGTNVMTVSSTGAVAVQNSTNSSSAFQVQNAAGSQLLNVDTANRVVTLNGGAGGGLTAWASTNSMSTSGSLGGTVIVNGYIYNIGGYGSGYSTAVRYAPIKAGGGTGTWSTTTALPGALGYTSAVTSNGFIYVVGGTNGSANQSTIYYGKQNSDGTVTSWQTAALPAATNATSAVVANGFLYVLGGNVSGTSTVNTYYTHINGDGSLNTFVPGTALPVALANGSSFTTNGNIYYLGGINGSGTTVATTYYATLNSDGSFGSWTSTTPLPATAANFGTALLNGNVYMIKSSTTVSYAPINSSGAIGTWVNDSNALPVSYTGMSVATNSGYIYVMGGYNGSTGTTAVYYTSGARTMVAGSLDLVGLTVTGNITGDGSQENGSLGGTLTAGNTTIVGTLQVQAQANFAQNVAVNGNSLTVGNDNDDPNTGSTQITVQSRGYAGINLYGDTANTAGEPGGAYIVYSTDGVLGTEAVMGLVQGAGIDPSGTAYTGTVANNLLVGTRSASGLQLGTNSTVQAVLTSAGNFCIGTASCTKKLGVSGTIGASGAITANTTPDLAETIAAAPDVEAADVVMADPDNTERVVKSDRAYNSTAVGVISDGSSSFMINSYGGSADAPLTGKPLVLAGRVPVKVSGANGAIRPGDYLTSSNIPGYAMKATQAGPTIGKALGYFNGDKGKVLVLVNLSYHDPSGGLQGTANNFTDINVSGNATINNLNVKTVRVSSDASINGSLTVSGLTNVGDIVVAGHIITKGSAPQIQLQSAAGQSAAATVSGNDSAGVVRITIGDQSSADLLAKIIFNKQFDAIPTIIVSPVGKGSAMLQPYIDQVDANGFMLGTTQAGQKGTTYTFNYQIVQ